MKPNKLTFVSFALIFITLFFPTLSVEAKIFQVNDPGDIAICDTTMCTLRGAIEAANTNGEVDTINIPAEIKKINVTGELLLKNNDSFNDGVDVTITGNAVIDAQKKGRVFAIASGTHAAINNMHITGGFLNTTSSLQGAGIHNQGVLELTNVKIYGNAIKHISGSKKTTMRGAGIYNGNNASLYLIQTEIGPRNTLEVEAADAFAEGAGIYTAGKLSLIDSSVFNNYALARSNLDKGSANARGGGIFHTASVPVETSGSSIYANTVTAVIQKKPLHANASGAGLYVDSSSKLSMTNSTISGNTATSYGYTSPESFAFAHGGAIFASTYAKVYLANTTVAANTVQVPTSKYPAGTAVGHNFFVVISSKTDFRAKNSIITSPGDNCIYKIKSDGYNVVSDDSCFAPSVGDYINGNPWLMPFGFNGGFTKTHGLSPTSTAVDGGNKNGCFDYENKLLLVDQRGSGRPKIGCDSGAFEV